MLPQFPPFLRIGSAALLVMLIQATLLALPTPRPSLVHTSRQAVDSTRYAAEFPRSHHKAISRMLKGFQRDLLALLPLVRVNPGNTKAQGFVQVYFVSDSVGIANHITPSNVQPDKALEPLARKATLNPKEFLTLLAGLYLTDVDYDLDRDKMKLTSIDSLKEEYRQVYGYRVTLPVRVVGKPNAQVQMDGNDSLAIFVQVYSDNKRAVRYARMQSIQHATGVVVPPAPIPPTPNPNPKPPTPVNPVPTPAPATALLNYTPAQKIAAVLQTANRLGQHVSDAEFEQMKANFDLLFDPSGFVTLNTKDGKILQLERQAFLIRARQQKAQYDWQKTKLAHYDEFRDNSRGKPHCRITTYHDVTQFDGQQLPVSANVTTASYVPVHDKPQNAPTDYWQLAQLVLHEK